MGCTEIIRAIKRKKQYFDDTKLTEETNNIEENQISTERTNVSQEDNKKTLDKKASGDQKTDTPKKAFKEEKIERSELLKNLNIEEMTLDEIKPEIRSREKKRNEILEKLRNVNKERNELKEDRNELNTKASQSFQKVQEIKKKRDEVNKEIKEIKSIREGVLLELKQISIREKGIIDTLKESNEKGSNKKGNLRRITQEIEDLDWKIQTTPNLNRDEEKYLMDRIDELSSKLGAAESVEAIQKEIRDLRKFKSSLKATLDDNWNRLNELVKTSQDRHNRISELYETGKSAKDEADVKHQLFITKVKETSNYRKSMRILKAELDLLYPKYKGMQEVRRRNTDSRRVSRSIEMKATKSSEIQKKLTSKKGLSMEEMKFLMENRLITLKKGD